ncbi:hypothetical protein AB0392_48685, partial [Nonomuraea angiospora]|uniref:hypothetical protein n=1 Tax=Nonomuraea angiospora TaxID=46172 RepID=UPI003450C0C9
MVRFIPIYPSITPHARRNTTTPHDYPASSGAGAPLHGPDARPLHRARGHRPAEGHRQPTTLTADLAVTNPGGAPWDHRRGMASFHTYFGKSKRPFAVHGASTR